MLFITVLPVLLQVVKVKTAKMSRQKIIKSLRFFNVFLIVNSIILGFNLIHYREWPKHFWKNQITKCKFYIL
jgi:hypothetical protein